MLKRCFFARCKAKRALELTTSPQPQDISHQVSKAEDILMEVETLVIMRGERMVIRDANFKKGVKLLQLNKNI
jgi:hypothetical protein